MNRFFNKLVRDKIPEKIRNNNEIPIIKVLNDKEYKEALITKLLEDIEIVDDEITPDERIKTVVSLTDEELNSFIDEFEHNLVGHKNFKDKFKYAVKSFSLLNKVLIF